MHQIKSAVLKQSKTPMKHQSMLSTVSQLKAMCNVGI
jgi:hypothetical protein